MASSGRPPLDQRLRSNLTKLVEMGIQKNGQYRLNGNQDLAKAFECKLTMAKLVIPMASLSMIVSQVVEHTYAYWDRICEKDEDIVWQVAQGFPGMSQQIETLYNHRLGNGRLLVTEVDKAKTWVIVHGLVRMCIKGIMDCRTRDPTFCSYVDLEAARRKWGVSTAL